MSSMATVARRGVCSTWQRLGCDYFTSADLDITRKAWGTGIAMHNRGFGFVTTPGHVNAVAGAKRPLHSSIPAFMTQVDSVGQHHAAMAFGVMGGNMQAQGHTQMVLRRVVEGLNPQACSDTPRWRINDAGVLTLENGVHSSVVEGLVAMGHSPQVAAADSLDFGSAQLIAALGSEDLGPGEIAYVAGSDHRRDGQAVGC